MNRSWDRESLLNLRYDVLVSIADDFILGGLGELTATAWCRRIASKLLAVSILIVCSPLLLATMIWVKLQRPGSIIEQDGSRKIARSW